MTSAVKKWGRIQRAKIPQWSKTRRHILARAWAGGDSYDAAVSFLFFLLLVRGALRFHHASLPTSLCYSFLPPTPPLSHMRFLCGRHLCGCCEVKRRGSGRQGPGWTWRGQTGGKGLLSCCITGRTTHHVPLEPVTWGTADVAFIDQAPAWSQAAACSSDWQPLVSSSFMHCLLLFIL